MQEADVVLTPVPQENGAIKNRPAIILREMSPYKDLLVCGISTQLHQRVPDFDEIISPSDTDFVASGLRAESLIRLGFLAVLYRFKLDVGQITMSEIIVSTAVLAKDVNS